MFKIILTVGKASYHIFLVRILFFGFNLSFVRFVASGNLLVSGLLAVVGNAVCIIALDLLLYYLENSFTRSFAKIVRTRGTEDDEARRILIEEKSPCSLIQQCEEKAPHSRTKLRSNCCGFFHLRVPLAI